MEAQHILIVARLIQARDAMKAICGEQWPQRVETYSTVIRARMKTLNEPILAAATHLAKKAQADGENLIAAMFLAVGCELSFSEEPPSTPQA